MRNPFSIPFCGMESTFQAQKNATSQIRASNYERDTETFYSVEWALGWASSMDKPMTPQMQT